MLLNFALTTQFLNHWIELLYLFFSQSEHCLCSTFLIPNMEYFFMHVYGVFQDDSISAITFVCQLFLINLAFQQNYIKILFLILELES